MKKIILIALLSLPLGRVGGGILYAQSKCDTLVVTTTPQMHCSGCEQKIKSNIRFVKGCKKIETSVPEQKVTLIYDGKKAKYEDFVAAFKKIGFEIKKINLPHPLR